MCLFYTWPCDPVFIWTLGWTCFSAKNLIVKIKLYCEWHYFGLKDFFFYLFFFFQFGLKALTALPGFITSSVHSVLFSLLAHPQLSIREHATKALSAILSRCEFKVRRPLHMCMYMMNCESEEWSSQWIFPFKQLERKEAWKNQSCNRIRPRDLCDTDAMLYHCSYQDSWELVTFWVLNFPVEGEDTGERPYIWTA